jgi:DNA processing protein
LIAAEGAPLADAFAWEAAPLIAASVQLCDPGRMVRLVRAWTGPDALLGAPIEAVTERLGLDAARTARLCGAVAHSGRAETDLVSRLGMCPVTLADDGYPRALTQISHPPPLLYVKGDAEAMTGRAVAIVGCRKATAYGRAVAEAVAAAAAGAGLTVVSGGALGIDGAAHLAAMAAGSTIAVMGCGADVVYPASHRSLLEAVRRSGCVISEFPPGTPPLQYHFPQRNRVIAGLAERVVVVEAGQRSGALITATFAADYGREVLAVPGPIWAPQSAGCLALLADGATPLTDPSDVWRRFGLDAPPPQRPAFSDAEERLLAELGAGRDSLESLQHASGLSAPVFLAALSSLELLGALRREAGGRLVLTQHAPPLT